MHERPCGEAWRLSDPAGKGGRADCATTGGMSYEGGRNMHGCSLEAYLEEPGLTEGQRRRLRLFQTVEDAVSDRVEQLCTCSELEVTDAAILVVSPAARRLLFRSAAVRGAEPPAASVILGHRARLHAFLHAALPPTDEAPFDPYADLLAPSPPQCVRVLILDEDSLTVLNYGAFVVVTLDRGEMPAA
ncbi:hypothetical protein [Sorangium sp. So ce861]|uniref:hypothetical protein n=1 Tax=Sorangium sp. So ce861 TaxID=3133323 RepID=UPI003F62A648